MSNSTRRRHPVIADERAKPEDLPTERALLDQCRSAARTCALSRKPNGQGTRLTVNQRPLPAQGVAGVERHCQPVRLRPLARSQTPKEELCEERHGGVVVAWGLLLLIFLAISRYDIGSLFRHPAPLVTSPAQTPPAPENAS